MKKLCMALILSSLLPTLGLADEFSGPGRKTLVNEEWGTIFCEEACSVRSDASGRTQRLTTSQGPISLSQAADGWLVQAPNQNLRLRRYEGMDGSRRLLVTFNSATYVFETKQNDHLWIFPGQRVFFTLREGELRGALGPEGAYKMHKKSGGVAYEIDSEVGQSQVLLGRKKLTKKTFRYVVVRQSGEELGRHPYMVKGVIFDNGPVGMFIKMPRNPVLDALDWNLVKAFPSAVPYPEFKVVERPAKERDPLQAVEASPDEDPNGLKRIKAEKYRDMKNPAPPDTNGNSPTWTIPPK
jgi:hypothetical protein